MQSPHIDYRIHPSDVPDLLNTYHSRRRFPIHPGQRLIHFYAGDKLHKWKIDNDEPPATNYLMERCPIRCAAVFAWRLGAGSPHLN